MSLQIAPSFHPLHCPPARAGIRGTPQSSRTPQHSPLPRPQLPSPHSPPSPSSLSSKRHCRVTAPLGWGRAHPSYRAPIPTRGAYPLCSPSILSAQHLRPPSPWASPFSPAGTCRSAYLKTASLCSPQLTLSSLPCSELWEFAACSQTLGLTSWG